MRRRGFTIIEVVLFIAISGFLIVGLIVGTAATVARQRYNDSVQDLAEFFRREYAAAINTENGRTEAVTNSVCGKNNSEIITNNDDGEGGVYKGRTSCLLYGRLITIGEKDDNNDYTLYSYDVIGKDLTGTQAQATDIKTALINAEVTVLVESDPGNAATCTFQPVGQYKYSPQWLARAETTDKPSPLSPKRLRAAILIVRSPVNGAIHTLIYDGPIKVQNAIASSTSCSSSTARALLDEEVINKMSTSVNLDICVGSDDVFAIQGRRRNVRILRGGHNSSAILIEDQDSEANLCEE